MYFMGTLKILKYTKGNFITDIKFENLSVQDCPHISFLEIEIDDTIDYELHSENYFKPFMQ